MKNISNVSRLEFQKRSQHLKLLRCNESAIKRKTSQYELKLISPIFQSAKSVSLMCLLNNVCVAKAGGGCVQSMPIDYISTRRM